MNLDWRVVPWSFWRRSVFLSAALLMLALFISAAAYYGLNRQQAALNQQQAERSTLQRKLNAAQQDAAALKNWLPLSQNLQKQGILGYEDRLAWDELLHSRRYKYALPLLEYELSAERVLFPEDGDQADARNLRFHASNLHIKLHLHHEGELLSLLDDLRSELSALLVLRSCFLVRLMPIAEKSLDNAHLQAECTLDLITLHPVLKP